MKASPEPTPLLSLEPSARNLSTPSTAEARAAAALLSQLPEVGPDRLAQQRVWLALQHGARPRRARHAWRSSAVAALAGLLVVGSAIAWDLLARAPTATLELAAGRVWTAAPSADWVEAQAGAALRVGTRLRTAGHGRSIFAVARAAVLASADTDLALDGLSGRTFLRLAGGAVVAEVEHRGAGESFVVQTTRYRVTVKGTIFAVRERSPEDVEVSVSRGRVEVTGQGGVWQVGSGESWRSGAPEERGSDFIASEERALLSAASASGPRAPIVVEGKGLAVSVDGLTLGEAPLSWNAPLGRTALTGVGPAGRAVAEAVAAAKEIARVTLTVAPPEPPRPPANDVETPDATHLAPEAGPAVAPAAAAALPPAPATLAADRSTAPPTSGSTRNDRRRSARAAPALLARLDPAASRPVGEGASEEASAATGLPAASAAQPEVQQGPLAPTAAPPLAAGPRAGPLAEAIALARAGRYPEAAAALSAIAARRGADADLALYELAGLRERHLDDRRGALAALRRYLSEYPDGPLIQEVELSAIQLELAQPDSSTALGHIDRFLRNHPGSERAAEVYFLRGDLLRARGELQAALAAYARVSNGKRAEEAVYRSALCRRQLGDSAGAAAAFSDYLQRFPNGRYADAARQVVEAR